MFLLKKNIYIIYNYDFIFGFACGQLDCMEKQPYKFKWTPTQAENQYLVLKNVRFLSCFYNLNVCFLVVFSPHWYSDIQRQCVIMKTTKYIQV